MNAFFQEFVSAARETPREFFAPIVGAYRGIRSEYRRIDRRRRTQAAAQARAKQPGKHT